MTSAKGLPGQPERGDRAVRWIVLVAVGLSSLGGYYIYDALAPVVELLHRELHFSYADIGLLNAVYSAPNVVIALLGGILVDRWGAARVTAATAGICAVGTVLVAATSHLSVMVLGRFLFGVGGETLFVAMLAGVGQWFHSRERGIAVAVFFSLSRLGSYLADISPGLVPRLYADWHTPLVLSAVVGIVSLGLALLYLALDDGPPAHPHPARLLALAGFLRQLSPAAWGLLVMGMLFYGVVFPFRSTFAIDYFQQAKGLTLQAAGLANSWVFFGAVFGGPLCGWMAGGSIHKAAWLSAGMVALAASFLLLAAASTPLWVTTVMVGFSFSLVPAVIWPAVAELVPAERLGATFGLMTILQNIGMALANVIVGALNDHWSAGRANPAGYEPMIAFFAGLSLIGAAIGFWLWIRRVGGRDPV